MTIYLSGPMTGMEDYNRAGFAEMEKAVYERCGSTPGRGIKVVNPWTLSRELNVRFANAGRGEPRYTDYLKFDVQWLVDCDAVLTLPGYEQSKGAGVELQIAALLDIPVVKNLDELKKLVADKKKGVRPGEL